MTRLDGSHTTMLLIRKPPSLMTALSRSRENWVKTFFRTVSNRSLARTSTICFISSAIIITHEHAYEIFKGFGTYYGSAHHFWGWVRCVSHFSPGGLG
jgi:hypothetical protein